MVHQKNWLENFFLCKKLPIPWEKKASTRASSSRTPEPWMTRSHPGSQIKEESWSRTPEGRMTKSLGRGRGSGSPDRRRSSSIGSHASHVSDEGLERLDSIEDRIMKFEEIFMKMNAKMDAMNDKL
jgi:hypothetical protein